MTEQPNCKTCGNKDESCKIIERKYRSGDYPCYKYEPKTKPKNNKVTEQPNQELMIVKSIQGLISQVNEKLWEIPLETTDKRNLLIKKACEEIDLFEKTTLFELQKAFE